jgi:hypothetical protein
MAGSTAGLILDQNITDEFRNLQICINFSPDEKNRTCLILNG